jgi:magnesium transporter
LAWYHFTRPDAPGLDELANRFRLHPLHMEDVRSPGERVKVEGAGHYTFALLKTLTVPENTRLGESDELVLETISLFASHAQTATPPSAGAQPNTSASAASPELARPEPVTLEPFFIVIADTNKPQVAAALRRAEQECTEALPARLLYLVFDSIVDSYFPAIDALDDEIDVLQEQVVRPTNEMLSDIFAVKKSLVDIRRLLVSTRDASMHLQRDSGIPLNSEHQLYLRDLYDHISRLLDTVETQRDLLTNALDIYLSSIANRTNEVMKVLTVLSTVALPALVVTGIYGMNIKGLPFVDSTYAPELVAGLTLLLTGMLLGFLRWLQWL